MSRTSLVQNSSKTPMKAEKPGEPELVWRDQELYLATMDYGTNMTQKILSEHRDHAAAERLGLLQTEASSGPTEVQLFRFRNPGLISFEIKGEMVDNQLDLVVRMSFGPIAAPEKRIPLVNLVDQFSLLSVCCDETFFGGEETENCKTYRIISFFRCCSWLEAKVLF